MSFPVHVPSPRKMISAHNMRNSITVNGYFNEINPPKCESKASKQNSQLAYRGSVMKNVTGITVSTLYLTPCKSYLIFIVFIHTSLFLHDSELFCPVPVQHNRNLDSGIYIIYGQQYVIGK